MQRFCCNAPLVMYKRSTPISGLTTLGIYEQKPARFLLQVFDGTAENLQTAIYCAGYEVGKWRCSPFAFHLAEWLPEYALPEEELQVNHANSLVKINQAAIRVYTSAKYAKRGEAGEIALHAICRDFFGTIPLSPRVFYKSASNDVVKAFDMVHVRFPEGGTPEIWLGESKLYEDGKAAVAEAIRSIKQHVDAGFLSNEKLLLGPQIPKSTPFYDELANIFQKSTSIDVLLKQAVFVVGIFCDSGAAVKAKAHDQAYLAEAKSELDELSKALHKSGLSDTYKLILFYVPLATKGDLVEAFDTRLKGLQ